MMHALVYYGKLDTNFQQLASDTPSYIDTAGKSKRIRNTSANGIVFGYMVRGTDEYFGVRANDIVLEYPVRLQSGYHTDGKGFGPNPTLINDVAAQYIINVMARENPGQREHLLNLLGLLDLAVASDTPPLASSKLVKGKHQAKMATYLLTWNPKKFSEGNLFDEIAHLADLKHGEQRWSCGHNRSMVVNDRVFLLRQGIEPRGIVGSGWVTRPPFEAAHWSDAQSTTWYVGVDWEVLGSLPIIPREILHGPRFREVHWDTQASGITIDQITAQAVEIEWRQRVGVLPANSPLDGTSEFFEGTSRRITVNAYARNPNARAACIEYYGCRCFICGFDFGAVYGSHADGCIEVHHLTQLSESGGHHTVDPIIDLRPVCANCHTVIHLVRPPRTIGEVAAMVHAPTRKN
ncbi:MAG TPA: hypothetical protein VNU46_00995 [Gemmatimonadaceae bacterium]|nr:hypothetical protein [Gemmatimonadaceae bacterium]